MSEEQVFLAALELADPADRTAYLEKACGGDTEFRRQVEGLLAAHFKPGAFLDEPAVAQIAAGSATPVPDNTVSQRPGPPVNATAGDHKTAGEPDDLRCLQPPTRPDSFGRLGHYEVLADLGRGRFCVVFRAFDDVLQRVVALKVLSPAIATAAPARERFLREARAFAQVRHENVVPVYAVEERPLPFVAMEFIVGETLQQRIDRTGPLEAREVVGIGRQIAAALAAAHATGLTHRDVKPDNVLLEAGSQRVKVTDFGLARAADDASLARSGVPAGTPLFMAPEQAEGHMLDHRADLFSLGSVLYVMASGQPPFRAPTTYATLRRVAEDDPRPIRELVPQTPQWLCDVIAKLQSKRPDDRFQSAREVADLLAAREARLGRSIAAPVRSGWWKWVVAGIVVLAAFTLVMMELDGTTHWLRTRQPKPAPVEKGDGNDAGR
jgi:serine/threonine protein kinase